MDSLRDTASLPDAFRLDLEQRLIDHTGAAVRIYDRSVQPADDTTVMLARLDGQRTLVVLGDAVAAFAAADTLPHPAGPLRLCPCTPANAAALRATFPWTAPQPLGTETAIGCGDRLGLATPGHIRACRAAGLRPVLAQQSIREMERTGRTPQNVLDDACWAVFQEGYRAGFGADADHLKTPAAVDRCVDAGFTMYTIDPSDYVDTDADRLGADTLRRRFKALPWERLATTPAACLRRYVGAPIKVRGASGAVTIRFDDEALQRAAVKYAAAIAHTKHLADHLARRYRLQRPEEAYDLEVSVDETAHPTRPREHFFVAAELDRLGVPLTSLAPRFVGDFQKGIDFIGDRDAFAEAVAQHARIAAALGDYKLSIHSGSDKFSIYPLMGRHAGDRLHLKTAGTSYLEALRVVARHAPDLLRAIVAFAFDRFATDRKTYHVTTDLDAIPDPAEVPDDALEGIYLDDDDGRQLLHITYGAVLTAQQDGVTRFKDRLIAVLNAHEETHYDVLEAHFRRHIDRLLSGRTRA